MEQILKWKTKINIKILINLSRAMNESLILIHVINHSN